jgi:hypothetical protein
LNDVIFLERPDITDRKTAGIKGRAMFTFFKILAYLFVFGVIGLAGYAYVGPFFGADFSAPQSETRVPVTLDAQ